MSKNSRFDLVIEQRRDLPEHLPLQICGDVEQPVHRPVADVVAGLGQAIDVGSAGDPAAAASVEPGSSARFATSPNSTRSVRGSRLPPSSSRVMTVSIPSQRHSASRTRVSPTGREEVNASSAGPALAEARRAVAGSSSRVSDATRRLIASRSSWSSRPKLCSTFGREVFVVGSHSLWVSCRYRTGVPSLLRRVATRTCTCPDTTRVHAAQPLEHPPNVCPVLPMVSGPRAALTRDDTPACVQIRPSTAERRLIARPCR